MMSQTLNHSRANFGWPQRKSPWWMLTVSVLIVCFGDTLGRWLGPYGGVILVCVVCASIWCPMRALGSWVDVANVLSRLNLRNLPRLQVSAILALVASYAGCAMMIVFLGGSSIIGRDPSYVSTGGTHGLYWAQALIWANHWAIVVNIFSFLNTRKKKYLILSALSVPLFLLEFM